jgi:hypothetical protein
MTCFFYHSRIRDDLRDALTQEGIGLEEGEHVGPSYCWTVGLSLVLYASTNTLLHLLLDDQSRTKKTKNRHFGSVRLDFS